MKTALLLTSLALSAFAQTGRVAGMLVDGETAKPIARARITLTGDHNTNLAITTSDDGAFSFDVPDGKYALSAESHHWHQGYGYAGPSSGFGSAIITGPGQDTTHLVYRWFRPGAIFGKVTDEHGEAVENATVQAIRESVSAGRSVTTLAWTARTDDLGNYRVGPVAAGTYYLVATATPWYVPQQSVLRQGEGGASWNMAYAPTYFPNSTDARNAARLVVETGGETQANFALRAVAGVTVHPLCTEEECSGTMSFYSIGVGGLESPVSTNYFNRDQAIFGVAPGRYTVYVTGTHGSMRQLVDLAGADASVEVSFHAPPKISGVVQFQGSSRPPASVFLSLLNENRDTSTGIAIAADGSFAFANAAVGRYRPRIANGGSYFIAHMTVSGAEMKDGAVEVVDGASVRLEIAASGESGGVKGLVRNGDKPAPGVLVVLVPRDNANPFRTASGYQTESDGSYEYAGVPAGDYWLVLSDRIDLEYGSAETLQPYLASATAIHIEPHQVRTENLSFPAR